MRTGRPAFALAPAPRLRAVAVAASVGISILGLAIPILLLQVYDRIIGQQSVGTAFILFGGAMVALCADAALRLARARFLQQHGGDFMAQTPARLAALLIADRERSATERQQLFDDLAVMQANHSGQTLIALLDLPFAVVYIVVLFAIGGVVGWIPVAALLLGTAVSFALARGARSAGSHRDACMHQGLRAWQHIRDHMMPIKARGDEKRVLPSVEGPLADAAQAGTRLDRLQSGIGAAMGSLGQITTLAVVGLGGWLVIAGSMSSGALAACTILAGRCIGPLGGLLNTAVRAQASVRARQRLSALEATTASDREAQAGADVASLTLTVDGAEETFARGTCSDLGARSVATPHELLTAIAPYGEAVLLGADARLWQGSILDNLTGFDPQRAGEAVALARRIGLQAFFNSLEDGYASELDADTASHVSAGIRIRINLVRLMVQHPLAIIVVDCFRYLDSAAAGQVAALLREQDRSAVLVFDRIWPSLPVEAGS